MTDTELTEIVEKARIVISEQPEGHHLGGEPFRVLFPRALLALHDKLAAANAEVERLKLCADDLSEKVLGESLDLDTLRAELAEAREDTEIIDALEGVVTGKRNSAFLKSVFITRELGSDRISVDIKCDGVTTATTLRMALGAALNLDAALSAARKA